MATFNWFGGYGHFAAARFWDPRGVPGAGDTAVVDAGEVVVAGRQVGATVLLGGPDSGDTVLQVKRRRGIQEAGSRTSQPCLVQNFPTTACGGERT